MIAALSFLLDYEKIEDDDDSDASSGEDDPNPQAPHVVINKQAIYNVSCTFYIENSLQLYRLLQCIIRRKLEYCFFGDAFRVPMASIFKSYL